VPKIIKIGKRFTEFFEKIAQAPSFETWCRTRGPRPVV